MQAQQANATIACQTACSDNTPNGSKQLVIATWCKNNKNNAQLRLPTMLGVAMIKNATHDAGGAVECFAAWVNETHAKPCLGRK